MPRTKESVTQKWLASLAAGRKPNTVAQVAPFCAPVVLAIDEHCVHDLVSVTDKETARELADESRAEKDDPDYEGEEGGKRKRNAKASGALKKRKSTQHSVADVDLPMASGLVVSTCIPLPVAFPGLVTVYPTLAIVSAVSAAPPPPPPPPPPPQQQRTTTTTTTTTASARRGAADSDADDSDKEEEEEEPPTSKRSERTCGVQCGRRGAADSDASDEEEDKPQKSNGSKLGAASNAPKKQKDRKSIKGRGLLPACKWNPRMPSKFAGSERVMEQVTPDDIATAKACKELHKNFEDNKSAKVCVAHCQTLARLDGLPKRKGNGGIAFRYGRYVGTFFGEGNFESRDDFVPENRERAMEIAVATATQKLFTNKIKGVPAFQTSTKAKEKFVRKRSMDHMHGFDEYCRLLPLADELLSLLD